MRILMIGYVWPEPRSSAAGVREMQLIRAFGKAGWEVVYASPARESEHSRALSATGIPVHPIQANDPAFDSLLSRLRPDGVIFDRFVIEEQFGWRVREILPDAFRILDTQDFHSLRRGRETAVGKGAPSESSELPEFRPEFKEEDLHRELASIYRSDLTWVLSDFEIKLLTGRLGVPDRLLTLSRFSYSDLGTGHGHGLSEFPKFPKFQERKDFVFIGNFRHPPNADGVRWLHEEIWPEIRKKLPGAEVHVYGAYPSKEFMELDNQGSGFRVLGPVEDAGKRLAKYRVNLAPLRFGAGIKGKITDGWASGTPCVATSVGAEGMTGGREFGGAIADTPKRFAELATELCVSPEAWESARARGFHIMREIFNAEKNDASLTEVILELQSELRERRQSNLIGRMLWHHTLQSTKYFSRWIELKNSPVS